jgi:hypothetical protein
MASYVVMEPPVRDGAEKALLVRDGFHFLALIFPVFWLLFHRLWIEALGVFVIAIAVGAAGSYLGYDVLAAAGSLALGLLVALEGPAMKVGALSRRGWREWGIVEAESFEDAETRYMAEAVMHEEQFSAAAPQTIQPYRAAATTPTGPALGMLGYPGRG